MTINLVKFLSIYLLIFCGLHCVLFLSLKKFLEIKHAKSRKILLIIFVFLPFSFIISIFLTRWKENIFTRLFYIFSASWIGILMILLTASLLLWALFFVLRIAKRKYDLRPISIFLFSLAIVYSFYGIYKASNPEITNIEAEIGGLSEEWRGKTIVQLSDVHLGNIHGKNFLEKIINEINAINPDLVLITGDLFDGMGGGLDSFVEQLNRIKSKKGVYFVTGNHEYYLGVKKPLAVLLKTKINILYNQIADVDGLQIVGISFPLPDIKNNLDEIFKNYKENEPSILMYHTPSSIDGIKNNQTETQISSYWKPNTDFSFAKGKGIDLQLSGHTHGGQIFPFNLLTKYLYNGYHYGLKKEGSFSIYTSSGTGTWGPPMRTGTKSEIVAIKLK